MISQRIFGNVLTFPNWSLAVGHNSMILIWSALIFFKTAASVVSSHGPTSATREHEKRILESILPPDLRHLVRGGSIGMLQVKIVTRKSWLINFVYLFAHAWSLTISHQIQQLKSKIEEDMGTSHSERGLVTGGSGAGGGSGSGTSNANNHDGREADVTHQNAERRLFGSLGSQSDRICQEMSRNSVAWRTKWRLPRDRA